jgi:hypothetical protein
MTRTRMVLMGSLLAFFSLAAVTSSASAQSSCDDGCYSRCNHTYGAGPGGDLNAVQGCAETCRRRRQECEDRARREEQARQQAQARQQEQARQSRPRAQDEVDYPSPWARPNVNQFGRSR